jgi:hypothetical protein
MGHGEHAAETMLDDDAGRVGAAATGAGFPAVSGADDLDELVELERELCRLPEVSAARVVADRSGRPTEVHILARATKAPKQIVRDVQSVALASFGLELDRRIISVVQLDREGEPTTGLPPVAPRFALRNVSVETNRLRAIARVTLARGEVEAVGFAEGSIAAAVRHRLVATATLDALRQLEAGAEGIDVDAAQVVRIGVHDLAVVTVVFVSPPLELLVAGAAVVRDRAEADAVVRAVLDATNRRLGAAAGPPGPAPSAPAPPTA